MASQSSTACISLQQQVLLATLLLLFGPFISHVHSLSSDPLTRGYQVSPSKVPVQWANSNYLPFLRSPSGSFTLGFQQVMGDGNYVLSIVLGLPSSQPSSLETVWTANRNSPSSADAVFSFSEQGSLLLTSSHGGSTAWSSETATGQSLRLEDTGNLVLLTNYTNQIAWQSFDHPTDTLLEGQNFTAAMRLVAPKSDADPSEGVFFLQMEVDGMGLYADLTQKKSSIQPQMYYKLAADQEQATIDPKQGPLYANMDSRGYLGIYQTQSARVSFERFNTYNDSTISVRRLKLDSDGNLRAYYWNNSSWQTDLEFITEPCELPSSCGPYGICNSSSFCVCPSALTSNSSSLSMESMSFSALNSSNPNQGCAAPQPLVVLDDLCQQNSNNGSVFFLQLEGVDSIFHGFAKPGSNVSSSSFEDCKRLCTEDCSCAAFFYTERSPAIRCFLAYEPMMSMIEQAGTTAAYIKVLNGTRTGDAGAIRRGDSDDHKSVAVVGVTAAAVAATVAAVFGACAVAAWRYRRRRKGDDMEKRALMKELDLQQQLHLQLQVLLPVEVPWEELQSFTTRRTSEPGSLVSCEAAQLRGGETVVMRRVRTGHDSSATLAADVAATSKIAGAAATALPGHVAPLHGFSLVSMDHAGADVALLYRAPLASASLHVAAAGGSLPWPVRLHVAAALAATLAALAEPHGLLSAETVLLVGPARQPTPVLLDVGRWGLLHPGRHVAPPSDDVYLLGHLLAQLITGDSDTSAVTRQQLVRAADARVPGSRASLDRLATVAALCLGADRPSMSVVARILQGSS